MTLAIDRKLTVHLRDGVGNKVGYLTLSENGSFIGCVERRKALDALQSYVSSERGGEVGITFAPAVDGDSS